MAARYLLDTNVCSYSQRQRPPAVLEKFRCCRRPKIDPVLSDLPIEN